ncbi:MULTISPECIES: FecR family protein [unclassified Chitinophaga]|uniref:FecR family protein n=1 Tax=unclassified Chitinophaga TaxID=2619133 RepID=UPI00300FD5E3
MSSDPTRLRYLFHLFVNDSGTPEEIREFWQLVGDLENDDPVKEELWQLWGKTPHDKFARKTDWDQTLMHIRSGIHEWEQQQPAYQQPRHNSWLAAAAVAAFLLLAGGAYLWLRQPEKPRLAVAPDVPAIVPGHEGAILTLSDGSTVVLDSLGNGVVAKQNGTQVTLNNGRLAYNSEAISGTGGMSYNTMTTPRGRQFQLVLPDGTKVWLNAESSLRYPVAFNAGERRVNLTGEAYFEVAANASAPFNVSVANMEVAVLGTRFNIMAYKEAAEIQSTLLEGVVKVSKGTVSKLLQPGQQAGLSKNNNQFTISRPDLPGVTAWKDGIFRFRSENIVTIMQQLARWYDIEPVFEGNLSAKNFSGTISRKSSLTEVLQMLELTEDIHFEIKGRKVMVSSL